MTDERDTYLFHSESFPRVCNLKLERCDLLDNGDALFKWIDFGYILKRGVL